ncbi:hypothetical protein G7Z17_g4205 [Cylindrodendrum hubeiense]|uniref:Peptidase S8/S53 domain-containing protein n=1 Tax=Cylindrodendrum hubeiense TaxID=595255 RepID=A0A9P5LA52_9HYPO|nr:hypothetical protein G7Z17_g4205 [Cylindrodendrum hubeiense]
MAPAAEICIAKITDNANVHPEEMSEIAKAINWAVEDCDADIISMSFAFENKNQAIKDAIQKASRANKLVFAAASNEGANKPRSRLARDSNVICIHACDGNGNDGGMNPSPLPRKDNFTTLGVGVSSKWKKNVVYKSGTSFATPVAAAIAADVLEFAHFKCELTDDDRKALHSQDGMLAVFRAMSTAKSGYDYVQPNHLWDGKTESEVAKVIQDILDEL